MKKIDSFNVNHIGLQSGIYVSRKDYLTGDVLTTFDIRFTMPNAEPVMDTSAIHAIEHLGATFLRNDEFWADKTVYFGPMGCRTGFYAIFNGNLEPKDIKNVMSEMCNFIINFEGSIPGASAKDCGNYLDLNLDMAKYYTSVFKERVIDNFSSMNTIYPK